jgi:hypothetical protein
MHRITIQSCGGTPTRGLRAPLNRSACGEIDHGNDPALDIDHSEHNLRSFWQKGNLHHTNCSFHSDQVQSIMLFIQSKDHELLCLKQKNILLVPAISGRATAWL